MRLTILGGGGFRVPQVYSALLDPGSGAAVDRVVLHDTDPARVDAIAAVLHHLPGGPGPRPQVAVESDLGDAVDGADFVLSAVRVGGLAARTCDERAALDEGLLGQETVGAGGVCFGLRTVPVAVAIAETVRRRAPGAWVINFTNPAGMVTEAMSYVLGRRVIGICDSPVGLFRRVARALGVDPAAAWFDYAGLNHLGWLRRVLVGGDDVLPGLLADAGRLESFEEGRLFGAPWLQTLGTVPNEYLYYYYFARDAVRSIAAAPQTRGEFLRAQQEAFYAAGGPGAVAAQRWEAVRREREATYLAESRESAGAGDRAADDLDGGGYERVALALMRAVAGAGATTLVLDTPNRSALPHLDGDAVVEVPCLVDGNGAHPLATGPLDAHAAALVAAVKATERDTIEAARAGSRALAVRALASHPLVDSVSSARRILDRQLAEVPELAAVLRR